MSLDLNCFYRLFAQSTQTECIEGGRVYIWKYWNLYEIQVVPNRHFNFS
jgi:hypothetical protein